MLSLGSDGYVNMAVLPNASKGLPTFADRSRRHREEALSLNMSAFRSCNCSGRCILFISSEEGMYRCLNHFAGPGNTKDSFPGTGKFNCSPECQQFVGEGLQGL